MFSFTYNGSSTPPTAAGTYPVIATFTSTDTNYGTATGSGTLVISPATPGVTVTVGAPIYDGKAHAATATAVGVDGTTQVAGMFSFTYNGSATAPTAAGTYAVVATFTSTDTNYTGGTAQGTLTVNQATPTVAVADGGGTYNGSAFPATGTVTGVSGGAAAGLEGYGLSTTYYSGSTATGTPLAGAPSQAGTYTVQASFPGSADYRPASATATFTIAKATPTLSSISGGTVVVGTGAKMTDSATLSGSYYPTGVITFTLYAPNNTVVDTETDTVSGNGTYTTPSGYLPSIAGTYQWVASYGGDGNRT